MSVQVPGNRSETLVLGVSHAQDLTGLVHILCKRQEMRDAVLSSCPALIEFTLD